MLTFVELSRESSGIPQAGTAVGAMRTVRRWATRGNARHYSAKRISCCHQIDVAPATSKSVASGSVSS